MLSIIDKLHPRHAGVELTESSQFAKNYYACAEKGIDGFRRKSQWFKCREYLSDMVYALHHDDYYERYGWATNHVDWDYQWLLCRYHLEGGAKWIHLKKRITALNLRLALMGLPRIKYERVDDLEPDTDQTIAVQVQPFWIKTCFHASIFTGLLRGLWYTTSTVLDNKHRTEGSICAMFFDDTPETIRWVRKAIVPSLFLSDAEYCNALAMGDLSEVVDHSTYDKAEYIHDCTGFVSGMSNVGTATWSQSHPVTVRYSAYPGDLDHDVINEVILNNIRKNIRELKANG